MKFANKKFSNLKNDYEITMDRQAVVQPEDDDSSIPSRHFSFVEIADLPAHNKDETLDVLGVIVDPGSLDQINTKSG